MSGYIGPIPVPQGIQEKQSFTATASQTDYTLTFPECSTLMNGMPTMPTASGQIRVDTIVSGVTSTGV